MCLVPHLLRLWSASPIEEPVRGPRQGWQRPSDLGGPGKGAGGWEVRKTTSRTQTGSNTGTEQTLSPQGLKGPLHAEPPFTHLVCAVCGYF